MKHLVLWALLLCSLVSQAAQMSVKSYKGVYRSDTAYTAGETCFHQGKTYIALVDTTGNDPTDATKWALKGADDVVLNSSQAASSIPSGMILFIDTGTCPSGWTEYVAAGKYLLLTQAANADVGTSGGSLAFTPTTSSISLTAAAQTPNSLTAAAQTFTGDTTTVPGETVNSLTAAAQTISWPVNVPTHTGTAASFSGTAWSAPTISWPASYPTFTGSSTTVPALAAGTLAAPNHTHTTASSTSSPKLVTSNTSSGVSLVTGNPTATAVTGSTASGSLTPLGAITAWPASTPTIGAYTPAGSVSITNQGAVAWPTNPPTNGTSAVTGTLNSTTITPVGHNASSAVTGTMNSSAVTGTVTMNQVTIQPTFTRLIGCKKD